MKKDKIGRNDPCHCDSGKKYKNCCMDQDIQNGIVYYKKDISQPYDKYSLNKNTLDFIEYIKSNLNISIDTKKDEILIPKKIPKSEIKRIYESVNTFFPHNINFQKICHEISMQPFSGYYWGSPDINSLSNYIARYSLYTPNIIITNPFCDLMIYHEKSSPLEKPEAWAQVTMNQALFLISLEQWIKNGIITVLPPIRWFEKDLHDDKLVKISNDRIGAYDELTKNHLTSEAMLEMFKNFSPNEIESVIKIAYGNNVPKDLIKSIKDYSISEFNKNPLRYSWTKPDEGHSSILKTGSGNSLESLLFTTSICNSYILFGENVYRYEFDISLKKNKESENDSLTKLSRAFADLDFSFLNHVKLDFILKQREIGYLNNLRNLLIKIWESISNSKIVENKNLYQMFKDEIAEEYNNYKKDWKEINKNLLGNMTKAAIAGGIAILSGQIDFKVALGGFAAFGIEELLRSYRKKKVLERLPMGVFLKLDSISK
jgi:hypothetical protein